MEEDNSKETDGHAKMHVDEFGVKKESITERCNKHDQLQEASTVMYTIHKNE